MLKKGYLQELGWNTDLLSIILLGLPAKQLVRFKSVSKNWNSLISDPQFCRRYSLMKLSCPPSGLFLATVETPGVIFASLDNILPNNDSITGRFPFCDSFGGDYYNAGSLLQTCNGLSLCCCCHCGSQDYFVCNFTTKQFNKLTRPSWMDESVYHNMVFAFDPQNSPHYKAVFFTSSLGYWGEVSRIDIYSSETGSWRPAKVSNFLASYWRLKLREPIFWNNALYWLGENYCCFFDMDEERTMAAGVPSYAHKFGIFNGHLHLMTQQATSQVINVYEMKKYPEKLIWFPMQSIDLTPATKAFPEINEKSNFDTLRLAWGDNTVGWTFVFLEGGRVIIF